MHALPPALIAALDGLDPEPVWASVLPQLSRTKLLRRPALDATLGAQVTLATETCQHTGSFKYRAALSVALHTDAPRLLTASSGNFGAALAAAAARTGKRCTVVMPERSAKVKIDAVRSFGAAVVLVDTRHTTREARLAELAAADPGARTVSPFDDVHVICGNATLGIEILQAATPPWAIVAPVGGGGLTAGLCLAAAREAPGCQIIGAEPALANDAARSLRAGRLVVSDDEADTVCDGARTRSLGRRNFAILRERLATIVEIPEALVARALRLLAVEAGLRVEPTAALGLAALLAEPERFRGREVVCVVSGGNVDPAIYDELLGQG